MQSCRRQERGTGIYTCRSTSIHAKVGDRDITIETGTLAKLAGGAVTVRSGDSVVLATAAAAPSPARAWISSPSASTIEERLYAAGRIPGSFQRREGRPSDQAILIIPPGRSAAAPALPQGDA